MIMNPHPDYKFLFGTSFEELENMEKPQFTPPEDLEVYDTHVPGLNGNPDVPIRVYRKRGLKSLPLLLNIHGGGFVAGTLDMDNYTCMGFALNVPCVVISVDYRLAPQYFFPAALEDCYSVLKYAYENPGDFGIDAEKIAVFGSSAGGNLAAGLCLYNRDNNGPRISMQILNYPAVDFLTNTNSAMQLFDDGPLVKGRELSDLTKMYLGECNGTAPSYYAIPNSATDLSGLPPAFIITCEYDPLRDAGIKYAQRLMEFAIPTELYSLGRVPHGFDIVQAPLTGWIKEGMYLALKRELGQ